MASIQANCNQMVQTPPASVLLKLTNEALKEMFLPTPYANPLHADRCASYTQIEMNFHHAPTFTVQLKNKSRKYEFGVEETLIYLSKGWDHVVKFFEMKEGWSVLLFATAVDRYVGKVYNEEGVEICAIPRSEKVEIRAIPRSEKAPVDDNTCATCLRPGCLRKVLGQNCTKKMYLNKGFLADEELMEHGVAYVNYGTGTKATKVLLAPVPNVDSAELATGWSQFVQSHNMTVGTKYHFMVDPNGEKGKLYIRVSPDWQ